VILRLISLILVVVVGLFYYNNFIAGEAEPLGEISKIMTMDSLSVTHPPVVVDTEFEKIKAKTLKEFEEFQSGK